MATTVAGAFTGFATKLKPTEAQEQIVASRRSSVEQFMLATFSASSDMPLAEVKVIGSAARKTLIRPVTDVDVFVVFDDTKVWPSYGANSQLLLYRVREALSGYSVQTVGSKGQAVRLAYKSAPHVDITPAFPHYVLPGLRIRSSFVIPRGDGGWQHTNPYHHNSFMADRNKALSFNLKPLVRLVKRWNSVHSSRIKSFHLEQITQAIFRALGTDMRLNLDDFFNYASGFLDVNDPAGLSGNLAASLTLPQRQAILQSFTTASGQVTRARAAEAQGQTSEALRLWRVIFGDEFPSYG